VEISDKVGVRAAAGGGEVAGVMDGVLTSVMAGISFPKAFLKREKQQNIQGT
jgi:hypothetical protein